MTRWQDATERVRVGMRRRIVGLDDVIEHLLICILTRNHPHLVGVPGRAKTLFVSSLAELMDLTFSRIQFTPDLMPSDITGTEVLAARGDESGRAFRFLPGPVFSNVVLADEINRTPPKTQAALMEAMEERQVTSLGTRYPLPDPFFVLATQNPIELEGTYPLPAAQLDRFMFRIRVEYPDMETETRVARRGAKHDHDPLQSVLTGEDIKDFAAALEGVAMPPDLEESIVKFVRSTRPDEGTAPDFVKEWIAFGAGPRAAQALGVGARARALLLGRTVATVEDVAAIVPDVVRHRLILNYHATAEGIRAVDVVRRLMRSHFHMPEPAEEERPSLWRRLLPG